jgi:hypothetical protein
VLRAIVNDGSSEEVTLRLKAVACHGRCQWGRLCELCGTRGEKRDGNWHPGILWREVVDDKA